jgi:ribonuclease HI
MRGGGLATTWEVIDAELYAMHIYLKEVACEPTGEQGAKRCLVLSDCKAALEELEREYRGCAPGNDDRHALHSAIIEQLEEIERHGGYTIFLWTPGHAGISPNAVADAIAKKYLKAERDITITRELARTVKDKACV